MKKSLLLILLLLLLSACGETEETVGSNADSDNAQQAELEVFTTVYPLTYFTERIGGERVNVQSIYPAGSNEHTFEPTQQDMIALAEADAVFYIGLGLESFIDSAKETLKNENVEFIATAEAISEEELEDGHIHEEESAEEHAHEDEEDAHNHAHEESAEEHADEQAHDQVDPHVWISPVLSQKLAESIKNELVERDQENAAEYEENYKTLVEELQKLNHSFKKMAENANQKTFFVSHEAFGYLADTYGLEQVGVAGLNSQDEPSQKELVQIVDQAEELGIEFIAFEQNISSNLTEVIQKEIGAEAVQLHNLSVLTQEEIDQEETYFSLMEKNLETLEKILSN